MVLDIETRTWRRGNFVVSTDLDLVDVDELNRMFASEVMWWATDLPEDDMLKALGNSLCFGLFDNVSDAGTSSSKQGLAQIGFARLVTDGVTFAWLTDVYVLERYRGRGLARFLMECIKDVISGWEYLRRCMLLASDSMDLYRKTLGVQDWRDLDTDAIGVGILEGPLGQQPNH